MSVKILGAAISDLDMMETLCQIDFFISNRKKLNHVITLNAEILYRAQTDRQLLEVIRKADLVTPDGSGIVWAVKRLTGKEIDRVSGVDLMQQICAQAHHTNWKLFFLGSAPGVAETAVERLSSQYGNLDVVGVRDGFFKPWQEEELVAQINEAKPDVLFVALGAPKQELWIDRYREALDVPVAIGIGGSLDVAAGNVKRAPKWMQKIGMEWFYRLVKEPWRAKRMSALPKFVALVNRESRKKRV